MPQNYCFLLIGSNCSGERTAPVVAVVMGGGYSTLEAVCEAIEADIPVWIFKGFGGAADFIAAAYDRRDQPSVLYYKLYIVFTCFGCCIGHYNKPHYNYNTDGK